MREWLETAVLHTASVATLTFGCGFVLGWLYAALQWFGLRHSPHAPEQKDE